MIARFSSDGRHIIAGTVFSLLYLLPDFKRVLDGVVLADKAVQRLHIGEPVRDLYWGVHKFKVVLRTVRARILLWRGLNTHLLRP